MQSTFHISLHATSWRLISMAMMLKITAVVQPPEQFASLSASPTAWMLPK
jgi:hypothetical protein